MNLTIPNEELTRDDESHNNLMRKEGLIENEHGHKNGSYDVNDYIIKYEGGSNGNHNHNMNDNHQNEEKEMSKAKKIRTIQELI